MRVFHRLPIKHTVKSNFRLLAKSSGPFRPTKFGEGWASTYQTSAYVNKAAVSQLCGYPITFRCQYGFLTSIPIRGLVNRVATYGLQHA
jgi:hypothetical protein